MSKLSLDKAIQKIQHIDGVSSSNCKQFLCLLFENCPYAKRVQFVEELFGCQEVSVVDLIDVLCTYVKNWSESAQHVKNSRVSFVEKLFASKGGEFVRLYPKMFSNHINRLSEMCENPKKVLEIVLDTIVYEGLELEGDSLLQLAIITEQVWRPKAALDSFNKFLSEAISDCGCCHGTGPGRMSHIQRQNEESVFADIVWHLLGDCDTYIRWRAARSIRDLLDVGLIQDVDRLLDRFDKQCNPALDSEAKPFAWQNAQQWLLMGLSRASIHHGEYMRSIKPRLEKLKQRSDLHVINRRHITRCLNNIDGTGSTSTELEELGNDNIVPVDKGNEIHTQRNEENWYREFNLGYEFEKEEVSNLARTFGITFGEAKQRVAYEVTEKCPGVKSIFDLPDSVGMYHEIEHQKENYRTHILRHALLHAATKLMRSNRFISSTIDQKPCAARIADLLRESDVSFDDGSWLSDHKDRVPNHARQRILGEVCHNSEAPIGQEELFQKFGAANDSDDGCFPIYGSWTSPDGVTVYFFAASANVKGALEHCVKLSRLSYFDLFLPQFGRDGRQDRMFKGVQTRPIIWVPERLPVGIDNGEESAVQHVKNRPRLGASLTRALQLIPDRCERNWYDCNGRLALKSQVWGQWQSCIRSPSGRVQDGGAMLWADSEWLEETLLRHSRSLIYEFGFEKYRDSSGIHRTPGLHQIYVGLKLSGKPLKLWFAEEASHTWFKS